FGKEQINSEKKHLANAPWWIIPNQVQGPNPTIEQKKPEILPVKRKKHDPESTD
ncbi:45865_t:CDS:2, partial [Gigaspora margarita]